MTNLEIAVYALYLEDGVSRSVHTEDIALRCFDLAPDAFSWVKHRGRPDKGVARSALMDARKEKYGALVTGRAGRTKKRTQGSSTEVTVDGWQLTGNGVQWVKDNEARLADGLGNREPKAHRQDLLKKLTRVRKHHLFREYMEQPEGFVAAIGPLAELLRCRVDAEESVWQKRFDTLRAQAQLAEQNDVLSFLDVCKKHMESREEGEQ